MRAGLFHSKHWCSQSNDAGLEPDGHKAAIVPQEDDDGIDEDEEGDQLLNLC